MTLLCDVVHHENPEIALNFHPKHSIEKPQTVVVVMEVLVGVFVIEAAIAVAAVVGATVAVAVAAVAAAVTE